MSGIEITYSVTGDSFRSEKAANTMTRSEEFRLGWALAYYQWHTDLSFSEITKIAPIEDIRKLYSSYHEMDIRQFCDKMNEARIIR